MKTNFAQQWLSILCQSVPEAHSAIFILPGDDIKKTQPLAKWPENLNQFTDFAPIIKYALKKNDKVCIPNVLQSEQHYYDYFASPVYIEKQLLGIIVLKADHLPAERHEAIFSALQQSAQWLELSHIRQDQADEFYASVISLLAGCFEQKNYPDALIRLVTELTQTLNCDRVALGEFEKHHSKVVALSNSSQFDVRSNFMQKIADAMDEAIEQDCLIIFPNPQTTAIHRAHQELARKFGSGSLLTIPMLDGKSIFGAITLFRSEEKPFDIPTIKLCEQTVSLLTPYMVLRKTEEQPITTKMAKTIKSRLIELFGVKNLKLKLAALAILITLGLTGLLRADYYLTADAILEGKMQRVIAAPIAGFLVSALVRAGDTVKQGEVMATLDDAELKLQLNKLSGQLQKHRREYREALSTGDLVKVRVISAQIDQATAEMELTQQQLQKIALTAPFNGVVIEGDLSQMLGSPVDLGDTLFKVAPLEGYRVILKVPERLISYVQVGQKGILALASLPNKNLDLTLQKITAVAKAENGENIFRVEANVEKAPNILRPGMEGIGKINAGRKPLLWIWTHEMIDWLRLWFWSWWF
jgi:RND family efflux transporter MFP subunit